MKVNIINGNKVTKIIRQKSKIKKLNKKGVIFPKVTEVLLKWDVNEDIKLAYYRLSKW